MPAARNQLSRRSREEPRDFALINADGNGGMKIRIKEIRKKPQFINMHAHTMEKSLMFIEIRKENTAAMTAT